MLEVLWNKFPQKGAVRLRYFEPNVVCMSFVIDSAFGLRLGGRIQTTKIKLVNFYALRNSSLLIPWAFLYCDLLTPDASIEWKSAKSEIWRFREMFGKNIRRYSKEANKKHPIVVLLHALACYAKWKKIPCLAFQQGFLKQKQLMEVGWLFVTEDLEWPENEETGYQKSGVGWNGEPLIGLSFDLGFL